MSMHILVVDDDRAVRESLARSLQYSGYEVDSAADGVEALAHLSNTHAKPTPCSLASAP